MPWTKFRPPHRCLDTKSKRQSVIDTEVFYVWVDPIVHQLFWVGFLLFHSMFVVYFALSSYVYHFLPSTVLTVTLEHNAASMSTSTHPIVSVIMGILAA